MRHINIYDGVMILLASIFNYYDAINKTNEFDNLAMAQLKYQVSINAEKLLRNDGIKIRIISFFRFYNQLRNGGPPLEVGTVYKFYYLNTGAEYIFSHSILNFAFLL